jgi:hypothetical protein
MTIVLVDIVWTKLNDYKERKESLQEQSATQVL